MHEDDISHEGCETRRFRHHWSRFQAKERNAYNGKALVIVRSHAGVSGNIELKAVSPNLISARIKIKSGPVMAH